MSILIASLIFVGILLYLYLNQKKGVSELPAWALPAMYTLKVGAGLIFLQFYIYSESHPELVNDAGAFLNEGKILNEVFYENPSAYFKFLSGIGESRELIEAHMMETHHWSNESKTLVNNHQNIIRVQSVIHFFSFGEPIIHLLVFCLVSLFGIYYAYLALRKWSNWHPTMTFVILCSVPSLLFWSSGLLKESFLLLGIGWLLYGFSLSRQNWKKGAFILAGTLLVICFKSYILIGILGGLFAYAIYMLLPRYRVLSATGIILLMIFLFFGLFPDTSGKLVYTITRKQYDFHNTGQGGLHVRDGDYNYYFPTELLHAVEIDEDSVKLIQPADAWRLKRKSVLPMEAVHLEPSGKRWNIEFLNPKSNTFIPLNPIHGNPLNLVRNVPEALINTLLRPLPGDPGGKLNYLVFFETLFIFGFLLYSIWKRKPLSLQHNAIIFGMTTCIISIALIIGWVTPVIGAIVRYRIPIHLALLMIALILLAPQRGTASRF